MSNGVVVKKHGRSGAPKEKKIYTQSNQYILYYTDEIKKTPTKHNLKNAVILLHLESIKKGKQTEVLKRDPAKLVPDSKCMSISDGNRELNVSY